MLWLLLATTAQAQAQADTCTITESSRIDCAHTASFTQKACQDRGCCWVDKKTDSQSPSCFYPTSYGWNATSQETTSTGYKFQLVQNQPPPYGGNIAAVEAVVAISATSVRLTLRDPSSTRYEVKLSPPPLPRGEDLSTAASDFDVSFTKTPFSMKVTRRSTGAVIFDSSIGGLTYSDQFLQLSSRLPSKYIYGLGENVSPLLLNTSWSRLTLFARDQGTPTGYTNLYGAHPFYLNLEKGGAANGVLFLNSNAMDVILQPAPAITFRTIGGVLDFYIFVGPTPDAVVEQYTDLVGKPFLPPYWSLGFHLCRWGYDSLANTKKVNDRTRKANIPLDVQWNDIDYMYKWLDFTYDNTTFNGLPQFVDELHESGQKYIMIIDPGVSNKQAAGSYPAFDKGLALGLFVNASNGKPWDGSVWPGPTYFPDFANPATTPYWQEQLEGYHKKVNFDGVWIDMNEIALTGPADPCPVNRWNNPPFLPGVVAGSLTTKTFCMDNRQYRPRGGYELQYNIHSLYGYHETIATMTALRNILGKRGLVISRSTFAGSGAWGGHWLGDNSATWDDLYLSIPGILNMGIFGIPMVGADICGFGDDTTEELCARWMQLGAFYPFSRNHNSIGQKDQDPAGMGDLVAGVSRDALNTRYELLPHLYSLFYQAHRYGRPVARPLFFNFPADQNTYAIDKQFMWGSQLLITPVLESKATSVSGYYPAGDWYDYYTLTKIQGTSRDAGKTLKWNTKVTDPIKLHLYEGSLILTRPLNGALNTDSIESDYVIKAVLNNNGTATGENYFDDGESLRSVETGKNTILRTTITTKGQTGALSTVLLRAGYEPAGWLGRIEVGGWPYPVSRVTVNGEEVYSEEFGYDKTTKVLWIECYVDLATLFSANWS